MLQTLRRVALIVGSEAMRLPELWCVRKVSAGLKLGEFFTKVKCNSKKLYVYTNLKLSCNLFFSTSRIVFVNKNCSILSELLLFDM